MQGQGLRLQQVNDGAAGNPNNPELDEELDEEETLRADLRFLACMRRPSRLPL